MYLCIYIHVHIQCMYMYVSIYDVLRINLKSELQMSYHLSSLVIHLADCLLDSQSKDWASPLKVTLSPILFQVL